MLSNVQNAPVFQRIDTQMNTASALYGQQANYDDPNIKKEEESLILPPKLQEEAISPENKLEISSTESDSLAQNQRGWLGRRWRKGTLNFRRKGAKTESEAFDEGAEYEEQKVVR
mmetsp:Transcript_17856/g.30307  ORF Transcript_17856/g.30307 Transcript_17856/m.30307 type:complete len:115 (-) Transcript_17856:789-1133(-)